VDWQAFSTLHHLHLPQRNHLCTITTIRVTGTDSSNGLTEFWILLLGLLFMGSNSSLNVQKIMQLLPMLVSQRLDRSESYIQKNGTCNGRLLSIQELLVLQCPDL
jgi:hypothetical protein